MPTTTWDNLDPGRRERILVAAMDEFGRHGYSAGSLNAVSREAGVAKGSLFQYFAGKLDLFGFVAEQTSLRVLDAMRPWLDGYDGTVPFAEHMLAALCAWVDYFGAHPLERGVTAATNLEIDPAVRQVVRTPVHRVYVGELRPLLERAVALGELDERADLDALLSLLILLLPHLALAPFSPGLEAVIELDPDGADLPARVARLAAPLLAYFVPVRIPS